MKKIKYKINLDIKLATNLRETIIQEQNISYNKPLKTKKHTAPTAWDMMCAIMDRIYDTVDYLNNLELNVNKEYRNAFDFYDLINNASVVIDCINQLANIFECDLKIEDSNYSIFNKRGNDNKGTDKLYFEYIRSLCSVHPVTTSRHERYQDNNFECCPYVIWNDGMFGSYDDADLCAYVYTNRPKLIAKIIKIYISEIFNYVKYRYNILDKIIIKIKQFHTDTINQYKKQKIILEHEFDNYIYYIRNLIVENEVRFGSDFTYELEYIIELLNLEITNPQNINLYNRYCNSIKYAIQFLHSALQNMSFEGYENSGIKYPDDNIETTLLNELLMPNSRSSELQKYSYSIEKASCLRDDSSVENRQWAYHMITGAAPYLSKYVNLDNITNYFELYVLVMMALYQDCLETNCSINRNIPNDILYRKNLLSDEDIIELNIKQI